MPIRQDDNQPNRRFGIVNIILIGVGALLLFSSLFPNQNMQIPRVPYSLFIDQVNDGEVKRAYITQEQIRYELNGAEEGAPSVLATTPIFDMDLPQRLESKGVEFAAAPPKKPNFFSTILSWVVPPLIFILVLQFFARRSMGGGGAQGALSFTKSKAKVYVPDDESRSLVHSFRAEFDAIIIGGNTLRRDNPLLTTRGSKDPEPLRVVFTKSLDLPSISNLWDCSKAKTLVIYDSSTANQSHLSRIPQCVEVEKVS